MTYSTYQDAIDALTNVGATQTEIINFVRQLSVEAQGSTTVLYSGDLSGTPAWEVVSQMGDDVRHISSGLIWDTHQNLSNS